jgi:hypothetical protein
VSDILILSRDDERAFFKQMTSYYDAPAYVRRARRVQESLEEQVQQCLVQRTEWLRMARIWLGRLRMLAGSWSALLPFLAEEEQMGVLLQLEALLEPRPRVPEPVTRSAARLRRTLRELVDSLRRFNERWLTYLAEVDLSALNSIRADYNRYYLLEKECALRSPRLARQGFAPLAPLTNTDLLARLPPLPIPLLRE